MAKPDEEQMAAARWFVVATDSRRYLDVYDVALLLAQREEALMAERDQHALELAGARRTGSSLLDGVERLTNTNARQLETIRTLREALDDSADLLCKVTGTPSYDTALRLQAIEVLREASEYCDVKDGEG